MRGARLLLPLLAALAAGGCARQQPAYYVVDPNTGQPVPVVTQQQMAQPQYAQQGNVQQQTYAAPAYQEPVAQPQAAASGERGLFTSRQRAPQVYAQQPYVQQPYPQQTYAQQRHAQQFATPQVAVPQGGPYAAAPANYQPDYTLDSGDKLRIVVFGQDGITNSYTVDAGGNVNLPLIGAVPARGHSAPQLSKMIADRLKQGYVREPHVSVEIETYRPFFILGEVTNPGQYPYVANMTAETAIAIAGGFAPRAAKNKVEITRNAPGQQMHGDVPLNFPLRPGDTILVKERWF
jgi:polysaccharide export outer membrane protein